MVVGKVTLEYPVAVSVELLWKVAFSGDVSIFTKACVGMIDAVEVDGDGGPGTVTTMKLNPGRYQAGRERGARRRGAGTRLNLSCFWFQPWATQRCSRPGSCHVMRWHVS